MRLVVNNFTQRDPRSRNALRDLRIEADFARLLDGFRPDLLHVHHLAGHALSLPAIARRRGIPVVYQAQDWWAACARANLLDRERRLCSGPGLGKCSRCLPATALLFPIDWPEPFGLAMIEAMSCGTPVIAWPHGAVREVIEDGRTGFIVDSIEAALGALERAPRLNRRAGPKRTASGWRRGTYARRPTSAA